MTAQITDIETTENLIAWLEQQPLEMDDDLNAVRRVIASEQRLREILAFAVARIELANTEGNPILSAWLPDAKAALLP